MPADPSTPVTCTWTNRPTGATGQWYNGVGKVGPLDGNYSFDYFPPDVVKILLQASGGQLSNEIIIIP